MRKHMRNDAGFTLTELMIALSVFSILLLVVYGTFFSQYSRFHHQIDQAELHAGAGRVLGKIIETIDDYDSINISSNSIRSGSDVLIDCDGDGDFDGLIFNWDDRAMELLDDDGHVIAEYVADIVFTEGPATVDGLGVADGVVLITIEMEADRTSYSLKGGINIEK